MSDPRQGPTPWEIDQGGPLGDTGEAGARCYVSAVPVRWSDQDQYHHVNHARMISLVEEARIPWLFEDGLPTATLGAGAVMTDLHVRYRGQVRRADGPIRVRMWCEKVGGALFVVRHQVRARTTPDDAPPEVDCTATIAAFDLGTQRPRRLSAPEREYLRAYLHEVGK